MSNIGAATTFDHVLSSGTRFAGERIERSRGVALALRLPAGIKDDPEGKPGLAHLVCETFIKATKRKNARKLSDAFDFRGIRISAAPGIESTTIQMRFLPEHTQPAMALLREILSEPAFSASDCTTAKTNAVQELKHLEDDPPGKAFVILRELFFGKKWGHAELGEMEAIPKITRADFQDFWKNRYTSNGAVAAAAGYFDPDTLMREVETLFANKGVPSVQETAPLPPTATVSHHAKKDSQQTQIALAFPAVPRSHPDSYSASLAVGILAGGMSGRLFTEVREKRSLCYSVGASHYSLRGAGFIAAYAGTTTQRAKETLQVLMTELKRLGEDATQEEMDRARVGVKAHILMDQESTGSRVRELLEDLYYENRIVPLAEVVEKMEAVTIADVKKYWTSHPADPYALATVGREPLL